ncbi:MAG: hypothetical protein ACLVO2_12740 [Clostridia bacterium]
MFEELKRLLSQFYWRDGKKIYIRVEKTIEQAKKIVHRIVLSVLLSGVVIMMLWFFILNAGNIGMSIFSALNHRKITYDLSPFRIMIPIIIMLLVCIGAWSYLHSRFSPVKNWRLIGLLKHASSELDLLRDYQHYQVESPVKAIEWQFCYTDSNLHIGLLTGGHISEEATENLAKRLIGFLVLRTHSKDEWILVDSFADEMAGMVNIIYGSARGRYVIDCIEKIHATENGLIQLDSEFFFNPRKQVHLICVGRTGSAKTTLLKVCLIQIVADTRNKVYICDGKSSYLSTVGDSIANSQIATTGEELLKMLEEIVNIIKERYTKAKVNVYEEEDVTYLDMHPEDGYVYFIFDEILALFSRIESTDKSLATKERLLPKIQALFTEVLQLGRAANVHVILSGQQIPATTLPTSSREAFGARIVLGRVDPANATEILGVGKNALPKVDTSNYGGLIWLDGYGWDSPKFMLTPYIDDSKIKYKQTLRDITNK